jgi:hypothetical protein
MAEPNNSHTERPPEFTLQRVFHCEKAEGRKLQIAAHSPKNVTPGFPSVPPHSTINEPLPTIVVVTPSNVTDKNGKYVPAAVACVALKCSVNFLV